ncbi:hypothetical protein [Salinibacter altiplanensis]|uniref:hypothetical protein n=1 Tax=Salinibacter altiplanensis TaxID=1803181 RepID=UPI000C9FD287|nr:hypothetical protein [Salinibacter altiplanensis]
MRLLSFFHLVRLGIGGVLLCAGSLLIGGCDEAGSQRASLYQRLSDGDGTWFVERLRGQQFDYDAKLDDLYDEGVEITFRDGERRRTYEIAGKRSGESPTLLAEGGIVLSGERQIRMTDVSSQQPAAWRYRFEGRQARLTIRFGSSPFLSALALDLGRDNTLELFLSLGND